MDKILTIGALMSSVRQNLAPVAAYKVEQFSKKILVIFTQNCPTREEATGASFCRMEPLRTPIERILSILLSF